MTDRAGRWVTIGDRRAVSDVARTLDCDWHTVDDADLAYGAALLTDFSPGERLSGRRGVVVTSPEYPVQ